MSLARQKIQQIIFRSLLVENWPEYLNSVSRNSGTSKNFENIET